MSMAATTKADYQVNTYPPDTSKPLSYQSMVFRALKCFRGNDRDVFIQYIGHDILSGFFNSTDHAKDVVRCVGSFLTLDVFFSLNPIRNRSYETSQ